MSTPTAPKPILTPLTLDDALDLADYVIWHGEGDQMRDRLAKALMAVDVASREQAQPPRHNEATCQTCIAIKAGRDDDGDFLNKLAEFFADRTGEEIGE